MPFPRLPEGLAVPVGFVSTGSALTGVAVPSAVKGAALGAATGTAAAAAAAFAGGYAAGELLFVRPEDRILIPAIGGLVNQALNQLRPPQGASFGDGVPTGDDLSLPEALVLQGGIQQTQIRTRAGVSIDTEVTSGVISGLGTVVRYSIFRRGPTTGSGPGAQIFSRRIHFRVGTDEQSTNQGNLEAYENTLSNAISDLNEIESVEAFVPPYQPGEEFDEVQFTPPTIAPTFPQFPASPVPTTTAPPVPITSVPNEIFELGTSSSQQAEDLRQAFELSTSQVPVETVDLLVPTFDIITTALTGIGQGIDQIPTDCPTLDPCGPDSPLADDLTEALQAKLEELLGEEEDTSLRLVPLVYDTFAACGASPEEQAAIDQASSFTISDGTNSLALYHQQIAETLAEVRGLLCKFRPAAGDFQAIGAITSTGMQRVFVLPVPEDALYVFVRITSDPLPPGLQVYVRDANEDQVEAKFGHVGLATDGNFGSQAIGEQLPLWTRTTRLEVPQSARDSGDPFSVRISLKPFLAASIEAQLIMFEEA